MKSFLIIGMSNFGISITRHLIGLEHDVVIIDKDEDAAQQMSGLVTQIYIGDAENETLLETVGVRNFDAVIITVPKVDSSIMITMLVQDMGAQYIVARASSERHQRALRRIGADRVVFPERDMGVRMAQSLSVDNLIDVFEMSEDDLIVEVPVLPAWIGRTLRELLVRRTYQVNVLALREGDDAPVSVEIDPERRFCAGDVVYLVGKRKKLMKLLKK